jgi:hypothetical protein
LPFVLPSMVGADLVTYFVSHEIPDKVSLKDIDSIESLDTPRSLLVLRDSMSLRTASIAVANSLDAMLKSSTHLRRARQGRHRCVSDRGTFHVSQ